MKNKKSINNDFNRQLAECVGLWLAEGDNKSKNEITFTNNCWELVETFHETITKLFSKYDLRVRIYVYEPIENKLKIPIKDVQINYYIDKRATKPYYIWRLASVDLVKRWKEIVEKYKNNKKLYDRILRGFFAGEGNIKTGIHNNRTIRIAQGKPLKFIEKILNSFKIEYRYYPNERNYNITGKNNWDKCAKIRIANLNSSKKMRFWSVYKKFKEDHYKRNFIKTFIYKMLVNPYTSKELSIKFKRSQARIYDVLDLLKKSDKINNFRVRSKDYWIRIDQNIIIVSKLKHKYLEFLKDSRKTTKEVSKKFGVCWKSSLNRLKELEKLGLVKREKDKNWRVLKVDKKVISL